VVVFGRRFRECFGSKWRRVETELLKIIYGKNLLFRGRLKTCTVIVDFWPGDNSEFSGPAFEFSRSSSRVVVSHG
jgi:hypothetical protein